MVAALGAVSSCFPGVGYDDSSRPDRRATSHRAEYTREVEDPAVIRRDKVELAVAVEVGHAQGSAVAAGAGIRERNRSGDEGPEGAVAFPRQHAEVIAAVVHEQVGLAVAVEVGGDLGSH